MDSNKINISKIETFLYEKIDNVVSKNTFVGSKVPDKTAIPTDWNDIVLIDSEYYFNIGCEGNIINIFNIQLEFFFP